MRCTVAETARLTSVDINDNSFANVIGLRFEPALRKMTAQHMTQFSTDLMVAIYNVINRANNEIELVSDLDSNNANNGAFRPVVVNGLNVPRGYGLIHAVDRVVAQALNLRRGGSRLWWRVNPNDQQHQRINLNQVRVNWAGLLDGLAFCPNYEGVKIMMKRMSALPQNHQLWAVLNNVPNDNAETRQLKRFMRISARLHRSVSLHNIAGAQQALNQSLQLSTPQQQGQIPELVMYASNGEELPSWFAAIETVFGLTNGIDPQNMPVKMQTIAIPEYVKNVARHWDAINGTPGAYEHEPLMQDVVNAVLWLNIQGPMRITNEFSQHPLADTQFQ
jgi:hypothetical protein